MSTMKLACLLIVGFCLTLYCNEAEARRDSTGLKIFSDKVFIVHRVDAGQTLYSISKKYKVDLKDIYNFNPDIKESGLKKDQYIFIPTNISVAEAKRLMEAAELKKQEIENGTKDPDSKADNVVWYTVKARETLFSISRLPQCRFTIDEIKRWNNLTTNSVKEGQKLIIAFREKVETPRDPVRVGELESVVEGKEPDTNSSINDTSIVVWSDITEEGLATWINDGADSDNKSYALYNKAKIGTVIRVENLANNRYTYVRVIGRIEKKEKKDVILVLTKKAAKKLDVKDQFFRVELVYSNDEL